jgi:hypothetical protein
MHTCRGSASVSSDQILFFQGRKTGCDGLSIDEHLFENPFMIEIPRYLHRKLARLTEMSPREVSHRLIQQCHGIRERFTYMGQRDGQKVNAHMLDADQALTLLRGLGGPDSLLLPEESRESLTASYRKFFPGRCEQLCVCADQIGGGIVHLFGRDVAFPGGRFDWHLDWATGQRLPIDFYRDIPKLDMTRMVDLKRVWETNRQQFLVTLGQSYFLSGREHYAESALALINSWLEENPTYCGVNWIEALEISLRLCSWLWTLALISEAACLTAERAQRILASIQTQRMFIDRHLSVYSSPNTHLLGEAMGLFLVGAALDGLDGSTAYVERGQEILDRELDRQFASDGSHREQSAYYHAYAVEMYLLPTIVGRRRGMSFPSKWTKRIRQMCEYLVRLCRPNGELARFGDDDGGRALRLADEDHYRPRSLRGLGALLFERGEFQPAGDTVPEEIFWLFGTNGMLQYSDISNRAQTAVPVCFPDAGFAVLSQASTNSHFWLACLGKPMGMMTAGHSHAAPLSFELAVDGVPILVDPGTYSYEANQEWRDFFRGPSSHNVLEIGDVESFVTDGPFNWKDKDLLKPLPVAPPDAGSFKMGYSGHDRSGGSYVHTRTFSCSSPTELRIEDRIEGRGKHRLLLRLQFAPKCIVKGAVDGRFVARCGDVTICITCSGSGSFEAKSGTESSGLLTGWYSPCYGLKVAAPALCFEWDTRLPACLLLSFVVCSSASDSALRRAAELRRNTSKTGER